ncbi:hypothetical protein Tco_0696570 [Tanacetum coccineum]
MKELVLNQGFPMCPKINLRVKTSLEEKVEMMMIVMMMMTVMMMVNEDDEEEEYEDKYVHTPSSYESTDEENEHVNEEEYDRIDEELYKDVNVKLKDVEHGEEGKGDADKTNVSHDDVTQKTSYDQVEDDAHVTLTAVHDIQKTKVPLQSSSVSSDFATQFLNLDNVPPADTEINSMMNIDVRREEPTTTTTIPSPIPLFTPLPHQSTPTPTPTTKATTSFPAILDFSSLFGFNQRVSVLKKDLSQLKQVDHSAKLLEAIKSQVPAVVEAPFGTRLRNTIQQVLKEEVKSEREKYMEFIEKSVKANIIDQAAPKHDWFKKPERSLTPDTDWNVGKFNNPKGKEYPFDLSKPLPLIMDRGHQVVPVDYFINNDLEYMREGSSSKKYMTSTTKTKAAKYVIPGIEDMVPSLWSPVKEGDFPRLHLHDIEDMLLLLVQKKLFNRERDVIFDFGVALQMFTRRIVILKRVEDLQLGVESYQKKLNITKPETFNSDISNRIPYTAYNNPQRIIYEDKYKRNKLIRTDELYRFSDGTLTSIRSVLHDIASNLRMNSTSSVTGRSRLAS